MSENENEVRRALDRHWAATQSGDYVVEHEIYHEYVVLDYPQSGERIVGRDNVREPRAEAIPPDGASRFTASSEAEASG